MKITAFLEIFENDHHVPISMLISNLAQFQRIKVFLLCNLRSVLSNHFTTNSKFAYQILAPQLYCYFTLDLCLEQNFNPALIPFQVMQDCLTSVHADIARLALVGKYFTQPILNLVYANYTEVSVESSENTKNILLFYYYCGMIAASVKNFSRYVCGVKE